MPFQGHDHGYRYICTGLAGGWLYQQGSGNGARVVVVNPEAEDASELYKLRPGDFAFGRDAAEWLPKMLEPVIGKI